ncbi:MAG TPA: ABC transporter permease [Bryobacteraceae bacterium]|nr:ABC transporter permease [Bryobacteraceae bacterium]
MRLLAYFRSLAARFFRRSQVEDDMEEELRSHIQLRADDLQRTGLSRSEAERRARVEFGGHERFKEECYEAIGGNFLEVLLQDARFSLRVLRKSPGFTLVAVFTLALAIGANALVFGVMNGLVLRPLDVPDAESLYGIEHGKEHNMFISYPDYLDLRDRNRSFEHLACFNIHQVGLDNGENPSHAWVNVVSGNYFDALHIKPHLGRFFHGSDEHGANSAPYVVLGHAFWQNRFQGDPAVLGRRIRLNKHPFTVIGVAPPEFHGTLLFFSPDLYVPFVNQERIEGRNLLNARAVHAVFMSLGHLKPGVTQQQAVADLNAIGAYLEKTYPKEHGSTTFKLARPGLYGNYLGRPLRGFLTGLMLLAGLILLAACANLGSLFAARAADRSREVALRLALGASRNRILRQLFTEAFLISTVGGALGLWASVVLLRALTVWHPLPKYPITVPVSPDANVYAMALILAVVSGLLFGVVPVRQVLRTDPYQIVKAGPGSIVGPRIALRDVLLVMQIAICAVLVTSSLVAARGLSRSLNSSFGFDPRNSLLMDTDLSMSGYTADQVPNMQKRMIETVEKIPGVDSVGFSGRPPLAEAGFTVYVFRDETMDLRQSNAVVNAMRYNVSPGYFQAAGTRLLMGRVFSWHDDENAPRVAVVNEELARKVFGASDAALGRYVKIRTGERLQIVGIVEDGKYNNLTEDPESALFRPFLQVPTNETWLVVRSNRDPEQLASAIRAELRKLDSALPVYVQTRTQQLQFALFPSRMAALSLGVMGSMGIVLAITGIFGMAAYSVSKRLKELGIRMALGAQRRQVLQAALGRALRLLAIGSAAGLGLGVLASGVLVNIVYQATPRDPVVLLCVVFVMLGLGLLATWIPARRALSVDPLTLLREE